MFEESCFDVMFLGCLYELLCHCLFTLFIVSSKFWIQFTKLLYKWLVIFQILIENLIVHSRCIWSYYLLPLKEFHLLVLAFAFLPISVSQYFCSFVFWSIETSTADVSERTKSIEGECSREFLLLIKSVDRVNLWNRFTAVSITVTSNSSFNQ